MKKFGVLTILLSSLVTNGYGHIDCNIPIFHGKPKVHRLSSLDMDFSDSVKNPHKAENLYKVTGGQTITFQRSIDAGASWSAPQLLATSTNALAKIAVLPDRHKSLIVAGLLENSLVLFRSKDDGSSWIGPMHVADGIRVLQPEGVDLAINPCNGWIYVVYSDPRFNLEAISGCVISVSKDKGITWSTPRPINPNTLGIPTYSPSLAIAKDGTVAIAFQDRRFSDPAMYDTWVTFFNDSLIHYKGEVRLTPDSIDVKNAAYTKLTAKENDFFASDGKRLFVQIKRH